MIGHLAREGVRVQRARLRGSIHRIDPINTAIRRSVAIQRRVYHSNGPNHTWHVDGNHKLIRWRLIIHGGIDGFSHTIVYLHCANNNRAEAVLTQFHKATSAYGIPYKVRSDLAGENVGIWRFMTDEHSTEDAVVTGASTHNQRIERLWRDVTRSVGSFFQDIFHILEQRNQLDPLNEVDIFCLHWVYLPKINKHFTQFTESWNNHPMSTENNQTPNQLFVHGMLTQPQLPNDMTLHQRSSQPAIPLADDAVQVPDTNFKPCNALTTLHAIDVQRHSDSDGTVAYRNIINIVGVHLTTGCNECA